MWPLIYVLIITGYSMRKDVMRLSVLFVIFMNLLSSFVSADTAEYFYDDAGRLVRAVKGTEGVAYEYDQVGNLLSISRGTTSRNPPTIQSIVPDMVFTGSTTPVVLTGQNLFTTRAITSDNPALTFKNLSITDTVVRADITVSPSAVPGPANITVTTSYGAASTGITLTSSRLSFDPPLLVMMLSSTGVITASVIPPVGRDLTIVLRSSNPSIVASPQSLTIPAGGTTSFTVNALNAGLANISSGTLNTVVLVTTEAGGPPAGEPIITRAEPVSVYVASPSGSSPVASQPVSAKIEVPPIPDVTAMALVSVFIESPSGSSPVASQPVSAKIEVPPIPDVTAMASVSVFIESPPGNSSVSSQPVSARIDLPATVNATAAAAVSAAIDIPASSSITVCEAVAVRIMSATEKALTIVKTGAGSGTVVSTPAGITCGANCTQAFTTNTVVTLTATPVTNSLFAGWSGGGCSGTGACTVTMSSDLVVTAQFENPLTVTTSSLPWGTVGVAYNQTLAATGGLTPYTWSITLGDLPAGLTLNISTGVISGTPTTAGTFNSTVQVQDANAATSTKSLSIVIYNALSITTGSLPASYEINVYSQTLTATGGLTPYTWSIASGNLPAGLTLSSGGVISGTLTTAGTSNFTVRVQDANAVASTKSLSIVIYNALSITTSSLPAGYVGAAYSQTLAATGGLTPYTWSIMSGSLPAGLTLNSSTGVISGTPTATGTSSFTVRVTDANSKSTTKTLSIVINAVLPDLVMTAVSGPTSGKKGKNITLNYTVKNQGSANAGQFAIGFYLSTDATIATGDILLKTVTLTSLNANTQSSSSVTVTIPAGTVGTYYIGATADVNGNIAESDETNNSKAGNQIVIQ